MASEQQVRQYLAYWFQLGKQVVIHGGRTSLLPRPVIQSDHYSPAFEDCWQQIVASNAGDCYLEGTGQTIADLLTPTWEITPCSRCSMPVPIQSIGLPPNSNCPCFDLNDWPNTEMPAPRSPVSNQENLSRIRDRLRHISG